MKIYIIIGIVVLIVVYVLVTYNSFVKLNNSVKEAFSTMDVYSLRNSTYDSMSQKEKIEANEKITGGISKIIALAESYPDLKANQNFLDLSTQLSKVE